MRAISSDVENELLEGGNYIRVILLGRDKERTWMVLPNPFYDRTHITDKIRSQLSNAYFMDPNYLGTTPQRTATSFATARPLNIIPMTDSKDIYDLMFGDSAEIARMRQRACFRRHNKKPDGSHSIPVLRERKLLNNRTDKREEIQTSASFKGAL